MNNTEITLVVSSSDKYEDAWYPYFELIKIFWKEHPKKICLITETKSYQDDTLDIKVCNYKNATWSERLYRTLEQIDTKYVIFSLEDFFLIGPVKQERIDECLTWMEQNPQIAECRLCFSNLTTLTPTDKYKDFHIAGSNVAFRVDTQVGLWNRKALMELLDITEDPWQFEGYASEREAKTDKILLFHHTDDVFDANNLIFPYHVRPSQGYGIAWGHWLWENKNWFRQNGIKNVKYYRLGTLSRRATLRRMNHLYNKNKSKLDKLIYPLWRMIVKFKKVRSNILVFGLRKGIKESLKKAKK